MMTSSLPTADPRASAKLRKSCDLCAATKLGCTKEKPSCARCAKRHHPCVYSAAKRAGRKSGIIQNKARRDLALRITASPSPTFTSAPTSDTTNPSTPKGSEIYPSLDLKGQLWREPHSLGYDPGCGGYQWFSSILSSHQPHPDIFGALRSLDENCPEFMPANSFPELNDLFASNASSISPPLDNQDDAADFFDFTIEDNPICLFPAPKPSTLPTPPTSTLLTHLNAFPLITSAASDPCQCLARALGLLAGLSPGNPGCRNCSGLLGPDMPTFERVLAQNEETSETVRTILQCSCANDSHILMILSLVVFRIIAWYTAATGAALGDDPLEPVLQGPSTEDCEYEDEKRITVQRILSKLAGVQASIDLLSQRLHRTSKSTGEQVGDPPLQMTGSLAGGKNAFLEPFSVEMGNDLETDLRKRLCNLSRAIVERLRKR
ncbi:hypothetical protein N7495_008169 [Penicillium taxi]|uniref:uncharacterized protein n=1 Tax=Penicillium taxi TaxID=168475 RepID=UPI002544FF51|nr:uncharacterized protein N7495_008169 [Penicillium taxi]KAJ5888128.1 hypothetical protein N7495_008169 [Penicillium taxi]